MMREKRYCSIDGCDRPAHGRGLCGKHYQKARAYDRLPNDLREVRETCLLPGCNAPHEANGLCNAHYKTQRRYNLTPEQTEKLIVGICDLCGAKRDESKRSFHVDHDHNCCPGPNSCGKCVRGILCSTCNTGLGMFKDDPELLHAAIRYLAQ